MASSVKRVLHALVELSEGPLTISEIARRIEVHRSTSLRLLRTLESERFVRRTDDGSYILGPRLATLAYSGLNGIASRAVSEAHLRRLGELTGHTIHLAILDGDHMIYIDKVESTHAVRMYSRIGLPAPLHATGVGKAILAYQTPSTRKRLLGLPPFRRYNDRTHTSLERINEELDQIADRGWALDNSEHEDFIHCVAAPIFGAANNVVAAVSISAPLVIVDRETLLSYVPDLTDTARLISQDLGWRGHNANS